MILIEQKVLGADEHTLRSTAIHLFLNAVYFVNVHSLSYVDSLETRRRQSTLIYEKETRTVMLKMHFKRKCLTCTNLN